MPGETEPQGPPNAIPTQSQYTPQSIHPPQFPPPPILHDPFTPSFATVAQIVDPNWVGNRGRHAGVYITCNEIQPFVTSVTRLERMTRGALKRVSDQIEGVSEQLGKLDIEQKQTVEKVNSALKTICENIGALEGVDLTIEQGNEAMYEEPNAPMVREATYVEQQGEVGEERAEGEGVVESESESESESEVEEGAGEGEYAEINGLDVDCSRLREFDEKTSTFEAYASGFMDYMRAFHKNATPEDTLNRLKTCLKPFHRLYFEKLTPEDWTSAKQAVAKLVTLIDTPASREVARSKLQAVYQGPDESVEAFASRLMPLVRATKPVSPEAMLEKLRDEFITRLRPGLRTLVAVAGGCSTFEEALMTAQRLEPQEQILKLQQVSGSHVRGTTVVNEISSLGVSGAQLTQPGSIPPGNFSTWQPSSGNDYRQGRSDMPRRSSSYSFRGRPAHIRGRSNSRGRSFAPRRQPLYNNNPGNRSSYRPSDQPSYDRNWKDQMICYYCNKKGHTQNFCYQRKYEWAAQNQNPNLYVHPPQQALPPPTKYPALPAPSVGVNALEIPHPPTDWTAKLDALTKQMHHMQVQMQLGQGPSNQPPSMNSISIEEVETVASSEQQVSTPVDKAQSRSPSPPVHIPKIEPWEPPTSRIPKSMGPMVARWSSGLGCLSVVALCLLTFVSPIVAEFIPQHPMVCQSSSHGTLWTIPLHSDCPDVKFNYNKPPYEQTLHIYKPNVMEYKSTGHVCKLIKKKAKHYTDLLGKLVLRDEEDEHPEVTQKECQQMIEHGTCSMGKLVREGEFSWTNNSIMVDQQAWGIGYLNWKPVEVTNCYLFETYVSAVHGEYGIHTGTGDGSKCGYEDGVCLFPENVLMMWSPLENRTCNFAYHATWKGMRMEDVWLSNEKQFLLSFPKDPLEFEDCGHQLVETTQGYAVPREAHTSMNKKGGEKKVERRRRERRGAGNENGGYHDETDAWSPTTPSPKRARGRKAPPPEDGVVTSTQGASQLSYLSHNLTSTLQFTFAHTFHSMCESTANLKRWVLLTAMNSPTLLAREIFEDPYLIAKRVSSTGIRLFPCMELEKENYQIVGTGLDECFEYLPIRAKLAGKWEWVFVIPATSVVTKESAKSPCEISQKLVVQLEGKFLQVDQITGEIEELSPREIQVHSDDESHKQIVDHIKPHYFSKLIMTNYSEIITHNLAEGQVRVNRITYVIHKTGEGVIAQVSSTWEAVTDMVIENVKEKLNWTWKVCVSIICMIDALKIVCAVLALAVEMMWGAGALFAILFFLGHWHSAKGCGGFPRRDGGAGGGTGTTFNVNLSGQAGKGKKGDRKSTEEGTYVQSNQPTGSKTNRFRKASVSYKSGADAVSVNERVSRAGSGPYTRQRGAMRPPSHPAPPPPTSRSLSPVRTGIFTCNMLWVKEGSEQWSTRLAAIKATVGGRQYVTSIDTNADTSVVSTYVLNKCGTSFKEERGKLLTTLGNVIQTIGVADLPIVIGDKQVTLKEVRVVDGNAVRVKDILSIGGADLARLGRIKIDMARERVKIDSKWMPFCKEATVSTLEPIDTTHEHSTQGEEVQLETLKETRRLVTRGRIPVGGEIGEVDVYASVDTCSPVSLIKASKLPRACEGNHWLQWAYSRVEGVKLADLAGEAQNDGFDTVTLTLLLKGGQKLEHTFLVVDNMLGEDVLLGVDAQLRLPVLEIDEGCDIWRFSKKGMRQQQTAVVVANTEKVDVHENDPQIGQLPLRCEVHTTAGKVMVEVSREWSSAMLVESWGNTRTDHKLPGKAEYSRYEAGKRHQKQVAIFRGRQVEVDEVAGVALKDEKGGLLVISVIVLEGWRTEIWVEHTMLLLPVWVWREWIRGDRNGALRKVTPPETLSVYEQMWNELSTARNVLLEVEWTEDIEQLRLMCKGWYSQLRISDYGGALSTTYVATTFRSRCDHMELDYSWVMAKAAQLRALIEFTAAYGEDELMRRHASIEFECKLDIHGQCGNIDAQDRTMEKLEKILKGQGGRGQGGATVNLYPKRAEGVWGRRIRTNREVGPKILDVEAKLIIRWLGGDEAPKEKKPRRPDLSDNEDRDEEERMEELKRIERKVKRMKLPAGTKAGHSQSSHEQATINYIWTNVFRRSDIGPILAVKVKGQMRGVSYEMFIDTNSSASLISSEVTDTWGIECQPMETQLGTPLGHGIKVIGRTSVPIRIGDTEVIADMLVVNQLSQKARNLIMVGGDTLSLFDRVEICVIERQVRINGDVPVLMILEAGMDFIGNRKQEGVLLEAWKGENVPGMILPRTRLTMTGAVTMLQQESMNRSVNIEIDTCAEISKIHVTTVPKSMIGELRTQWGKKPLLADLGGTTELGSAGFVKACVRLQDGKYLEHTFLVTSVRMTAEVILGTDAMQQLPKLVINNRINQWGFDIEKIARNDPWNYEPLFREPARHADELPISTWVHTQAGILRVVVVPSEWECDMIVEDHNETGKCFPHLLPGSIRNSGSAGSSPWQSMIFSGVETRIHCVADISLKDRRGELLTFPIRVLQRREPVDGWEDTLLLTTDTWRRWRQGERNGMVREIALLGADRLDGPIWAELDAAPILFLTIEWYGDRNLLWLWYFRWDSYLERNRGNSKLEQVFTTFKETHQPTEWNQAWILGKVLQLESYIETVVIHGKNKPVSTHGSVEFVVEIRLSVREWREKGMSIDGLTELLRSKSHRRIQKGEMGLECMWNTEACRNPEGTLKTRVGAKLKIVLLYNEYLPRQQLARTLRANDEKRTQSHIRGNEQGSSSGVQGQGTQAETLRKFLGVRSTLNPSDEGAFITVIRGWIGSRETVIVIDSGSTVSLISEDLKELAIGSASEVGWAASQAGHWISFLEAAHTSITIGTTTRTVMLRVVDQRDIKGSNFVLLGCDALSVFPPLSFDLTSKWIGIEGITVDIIDTKTLGIEFGWRRGEDREIHSVGGLPQWALVNPWEIEACPLVNMLWHTQQRQILIAMLDTGSSKSYLSLRNVPADVFLGIGGEFRSETQKDNRDITGHVVTTVGEWKQQLSIGIYSREVTLGVTYSENIPPTVDAVIGTDVLRQFPVFTIDFGKKKVRVGASECRMLPDSNPVHRINMGTQGDEGERADTNKEITPTNDEEQAVEAIDIPAPIEQLIAIGHGHGQPGVPVLDPPHMEFITLQGETEYVGPFSPCCWQDSRIEDNLIEQGVMEALGVTYEPYTAPYMMRNKPIQVVGKAQLQVGSEVEGRVDVMNFLVTVNGVLNESCWHRVILGRSATQTRSGAPQGKIVDLGAPPTEIQSTLLAMEDLSHIRELNVKTALVANDKGIRELMAELGKTSLTCTNNPVTMRAKILDKGEVETMLGESLLPEVVAKAKDADRHLSLMRRWLTTFQGPAKINLRLKVNINYQVDEQGDKWKRLMNRAREVEGLVTGATCEFRIKNHYVHQHFTSVINRQRRVTLEIMHMLVNTDVNIQGGVTLTMDDYEEAEAEERRGLLNPEQPSTSDSKIGLAHTCSTSEIMACDSTKAVVDVMVNGMRTRALIDTGASLSVAPVRMLDALRLKANKTQFNALSASGHWIPITALAEVTVRMAGTEDDATISFTDNQYFGPNKKYDMILGCDWFRKIPPITFDFKNNRLTHAGTTVGMDSSGEGSWEEISVRTIDTITIPPDTQVIIDARVEQPTSVVQKTMLVGRLENKWIEEGLAAPPVMVCPNKNQIKMVVFNPTQQPVTIYRNKTVAYASEVFQCEDGQFAEVARTKNTGLITAIDKQEGEVEVDPTYVIDYSKTTAKGRDLEKLKQLNMSYSDVMSKSQYDLGDCNIGEHKIVTTTDTPVASKPSRVPHKYKDELKSHLHRLQKSGVAVESDTPWVSNIVLVVKKDGSLRPCIDFRKLNKITVPDHYPLPRLEDILERVGSCHYYTSLDLSSGYLQLRLDKDASRKCGVITEDKILQMTHLPFGLKNATSSFARTMAHVLTGLEDCVLAYVDDILIFTKEDDFDKHVRAIEEVYKRFRLYNLKLSPKKCIFAAAHMSFLGHEINEKGYYPSLSKCEMIKEIPAPKTLRQVRRFIGMASFFRKFIRNFATIVEPMVKLTRKETKFAWGEEEQRSFDHIKELLMSKPILTFPDYTKAFHIFTDASIVGQGGALMQKDEENRYTVVAYFSRTLSSAERRWATVHIELGAIIVALREFKPFIFMADVELHCDHLPLTYLMDNHKANPSLGRWLIELNNYQIKIVHVRGKQNTLADALSRLSEEVEEEEIKDIKELEDIAEFPVCLSIESTDRISTEGSSQTMILRTGDGDTMSIDVKKEQSNDEQAGKMVKFLEDGTVPEDFNDKDRDKFLGHCLNLEMHEGILYHHPLPHEKNRRRLFVPTSLRTLVFDSFHISPLGGGHMSIKKTSGKCSRKYFWPNMHRDIVYWTKCCVTCQLRNHPTPRYRAEMLSTPANTLFATIGLDLMGPFPITDNGYKHVMNVVCWFTKYIISIPVPDGTAKTLAHALLTKVYLVYGGCTRLISDSASAFTAHFYREFCSLLYINKHFATPHWSQGNSVTERTFRTYQDILAKYMAKSDRNFDEFLPFATFCYNTAVHSTTQETPFFLMFGRDPIFSIDQMLDPKVREPEPVTDTDEFKKRLITSLRLAWEAADTCTKKAQEAGKTQYDKRTRPNPIEVGDRVLLRNYAYQKGRSRKLHSPYKGVYRVIELEGVHATIVSCSTPQANPLVVNINQIKRCHEWEHMGGTFSTNELDGDEREALKKAKATEIFGKPGYAHTSKSCLKDKEQDTPEQLKQPKPKKQVRFDIPPPLKSRRMETQEAHRPKMMKTTSGEPFLAFFGKQAFCSNHNCTPGSQPQITLDGHHYECAEKAYVHLKMKLFGRLDLEEHLFNTHTGAAAKEAGKKLGKELTGELGKVASHRLYVCMWDEVAVLVMAVVNAAKYTQGEQYRKELLGTGGRPLVETNPHDPTWGIGKSMEDKEVGDTTQWGRNLLGRVLVEIRRYLRAERAAEATMRTGTELFAPLENERTKTLGDGHTSMQEWVEEEVKKAFLTLGFGGITEGLMEYFEMRNRKSLLEIVKKHDRNSRVWSWAVEVLKKAGTEIAPEVLATQQMGEEDEQDWCNKLQQGMRLGDWNDAIRKEHGDVTTDDEDEQMEVGEEEPESPIEEGAATEYTLTSIDQIGVKLNLVADSVTALLIDVMVNSAASDLAPKGTLSNTIHNRAGPQLQAACAEIGPCPAGEARITPSFRLTGATAIIHAVGPQLEADTLPTKAHRDQLVSAYLSALNLARTSELRSVALPCISTGSGRFPKEEAAQLALKAVRAWLMVPENFDAMDDIVFCVPEGEAFELYERLLSASYDAVMEKELAVLAIKLVEERKKQEHARSLEEYPELEALEAGPSQQRGQKRTRDLSSGPSSKIRPAEMKEIDRVYAEAVTAKQDYPRYMICQPAKLRAIGVLVSPGVWKDCPTYVGFEATEEEMKAPSKFQYGQQWLVKSFVWEEKYRELENREVGGDAFKRMGKEKEGAKPAVLVQESINCQAIVPRDVSGIENGQPPELVFQPDQHEVIGVVSKKTKDTLHVHADDTLMPARIEAWAAEDFSTKDKVVGSRVVLVLNEVPTGTWVGSRYIFPPKAEWHSEKDRNSDGPTYVATHAREYKVEEFEFEGMELAQKIGHEQQLYIANTQLYMDDMVAEERKYSFLSTVRPIAEEHMYEVLVEGAFVPDTEKIFLAGIMDRFSAGNRLAVRRNWNTKNLASGWIHRTDFRERADRHGARRWEMSVIVKLVSYENDKSFQQAVINKWRLRAYVPAQTTRMNNVIAALKSGKLIQAAAKNTPQATIIKKCLGVLKQKLSTCRVNHAADLQGRLNTQQLKAGSALICPHTTGDLIAIQAPYGTGKTLSLHWMVLLLLREILTAVAALLCSMNSPLITLAADIIAAMKEVGFEVPIALVLSRKAMEDYDARIKQLGLLPYVCTLEVDDEGKVMGVSKEQLLRRLDDLKPRLILATPDKASMVPEAFAKCTHLVADEIGKVPQVLILHLTAHMPELVKLVIAADKEQPTMHTMGLPAALQVERTGYGSMLELVIGWEYPMISYKLTYRANTEIARDFADSIYDGKISPPAELEGKRRILLDSGLNLPVASYPMILLDNKAREQEWSHAKSSFNPAETEVALDLYQHMLKLKEDGRMPPTTSIGFVCYYKGAVEHTFRRAMNRGLPLERANIRTVDAFIGGQWNIVFLLTTMSHATPFLIDPQRATAAWTRCTDGLVVIANFATYAREGRIKKIVEAVTRHTPILGTPALSSDWYGKCGMRTLLYPGPRTRNLGVAMDGEHMPLANGYNRTFNSKWMDEQRAQDGGRRLLPRDGY